jgi:ribonuclease HII
MSGATPASLNALGTRLRQVRDPAALERLLATLSGDTRAGAAALAERIGRQLAALRADAVRVAGLFALRARLREAGALHVAGVDEVGMGPLAGPVVAAAVILPECVDLPGLDDSKQLAPPVRERLAAAIRAQALAVAVGEVSAAELDRMNVYRAGLEAMRRAVTALTTTPHHLLVDARTVPGVGFPQTPIVGGDALDGSIAAASIVAKVHRDALLRRLDAEHPGYGFCRHMGYATPEHLAALRRLGPCPEHRRSFAPCAVAPPS